MPTVCSETCVGRIRYMGVMLYDADKIKDLYHNNDEFQVLLHSYTDLDEKIYKIETDEELAMDDELSHLRKDRVFLKDEIFNFLKGS